ncbi:hypothetical protein WEI85_19730 [Actinomycetes bacterium KLBMP 9797]
MIVWGVTTAHLDPAVARIWLAAVHQAARETGKQVLGAVQLPAVGRNHYLIRVGANSGRLRLLLNAATTLVTAADDTDPHALAPAFRAVPRPELFTAVGLHVATPADLEQPLTDAHLTDLNATERQDIGYHRPARVGGTRPGRYY